MKVFLLLRKNGYKKNIPDFPLPFKHSQHAILYCLQFFISYISIYFSIFVFPVIVLITISKVITSFYFWFIL